MTSLTCMPTAVRSRQPSRPPGAWSCPTAVTCPTSSCPASSTLLSSVSSRPSSGQNPADGTGSPFMPLIVRWVLVVPVGLTVLGQVQEVGGGDLEGQVWWGFCVHCTDLGADDEQFPVHGGQGGGAVPAGVGQFGHDRSRVPARCQPGCADHEAEVLD